VNELSGIQAFKKQDVVAQYHMALAMAKTEASDLYAGNLTIAEIPYS
jgi:hypothetical protein